MAENPKGPIFLFAEWDIQDGWLNTLIRQGHKSRWVSYDECLSDVPIGLVAMYNAVLQRRNYTFSEWTHAGSLVFASRMTSREIVKFIISCTYGEDCVTRDWQEAWQQIAKDKTKGIIFYETYQREEFLSVLDNWFQALLRHPDFPVQYPCFSMLDDEAYFIRIIKRCCKSMLYPNVGIRKVIHRFQFHKKNYIWVFSVR